MENHGHKRSSWSFKGRMGGEKLVKEEKLALYGDKPVRSRPMPLIGLNFRMDGIISAIL